MPRPEVSYPTLGQRRGNHPVAYDDPMDVEGFEHFLKSGGRSPSAAGRAIEFVRHFEAYLSTHGVEIDDADPSDLESYVASVEVEPGVSAKLELWGLGYYYEYLDDPIMVHIAATMRRDRVEENPFRLRQFRGVSQTTTDRLADIGIRSADDLLAAAGSPSARSALAAQAAISVNELEELVRLADLARIPGLKSIGTRLCLDAGVRSVEELTRWDPDELVAVLRDFIRHERFDGLAPSPSEAGYAVESAKALPTVVSWQADDT